MKRRDFIAMMDQALDPDTSASTPFPIAKRRNHQNDEELAKVVGKLAKMSPKGRKGIAPLDPFEIPPCF